MTENFSERIENALNDIQKIQLLFRQRYGEECLADKEIEEVIKIAKSEHEEIQQYRAIGTVEECREARERQRGKNPVEYEDKYYACPVCDNFLMYKWEKYPSQLKDKKCGLPYCLSCGQAISWECDTD